MVGKRTEQASDLLPVVEVGRLELLFIRLLHMRSGGYRRSDLRL
jgi:hypothetical protein